MDKTEAIALWLMHIEQTEDGQHTLAATDAILAAYQRGIEDAIKAVPEQSEPYAWHYWNNGGGSVWHRGPSAKLDADMQAARDYPRVHHCIPVYDHPVPPSALSEPKQEK